MDFSAYPIDGWNERLEGQPPEAILDFVYREFGHGIAFATSLGAEDQLLTHMISAVCPGMRIFTLDTGRLFPETYDLIHTTNSRYSCCIEIYFPDSGQVEDMVRRNGINLFYDSVGQRKLCCEVRKLEPLKRAVRGLTAWVSGLRREQAASRTEVRIIEADSANGLIKVNPLAGWTEKQVWDRIRQDKIPYHPLHDKDYPSIGCQPCTRAVLPGEDVRAGRWWWENPESRECGLHRKPGGH